MLECFHKKNHNNSDNFLRQLPQTKTFYFKKLNPKMRKYNKHFLSCFFLHCHRIIQFLLFSLFCLLFPLLCDSHNEVHCLESIKHLKLQNTRLQNYLSLNPRNKFLTKIEYEIYNAGRPVDFLSF